jgi:hypothetical protein
MLENAISVRYMVIRKAIFDNLFHKAEIYHLQSPFEPNNFFLKKITLARITPYTGGASAKNP